MRARVNDRLERAIRFPVTLIAAPAGFGKTSALRDFIESTRLDVVRYDVRRDDNTLLGFVQSLSEALEPVAPSALAAFPAIQERVLSASEPVRQLSDWFAEHLKRTVCTVVIDDLHFAAADPGSIALLADIIERSGDRIKWIIAARSDAGLPVGSWIAYGRMDIPISEDDLRFTADEALAAADANATDLDASEIESLRQFTEGWPVALTIALRTRIHAQDLQSASLGTKEMVYRYLAEQVLSGLSQPQRAFALSTSVFASFDVATAEMLGATAATLVEFRSRVTFLNEIAPGQYRYHDLFRDFLESELLREGDGAWEAAVTRAAQILEARNNFIDALTLYTKVRSISDIIRIVDERGFALFERGASERLAAALDVVGDSRLAQHAGALGLKAVIEAARGHFALVKRRFVNAIHAAENDDRLRMSLVQRYAIELVRYDQDCVEFVSPYAHDNTLMVGHRVPLLGTLATAYASSGAVSQAIATIDEALSLLDSRTADDEMQARLYQQAAYVYHMTPEVEKTRNFAQAAIDLALRHNLYEVAARAYTVLFTLAYNEEDPISSLRMLDRVEENAVKGASQQAHIFALIASYEIEAERGSEAALERLDAALHDHEGLLPQARFEALAPAFALRSSWSGDFSTAAAALRETIGSTTVPERRALRAAEAALYAAAAGDRDAVSDASAIAADVLARIPPQHRRAIRIRCFLALADLLRGHEANAQRLLNEAERALTPSMRRLRALVTAIRAYQQARTGQIEHATLAASLERLSAEHFGGFARMLANLPVMMDQSHALAVLTTAEKDILRLLAAGASTKDVASRTGRSPHTVDTHIRSICRKLNCSGRREAVALATSRGWV